MIKTKIENSTLDTLVKNYKNLTMEYVKLIVELYFG
jgi:hypothetical protein